MKKFIKQLLSGLAEKPTFNTSSTSTDTQTNICILLHFEPPRRWDRHVEAWNRNAAAAQLAQVNYIKKGWTNMEIEQYRKNGEEGKSGIPGWWLWLLETFVQRRRKIYSPGPFWTWRMRRHVQGTEWPSWCFLFFLLLTPHCRRQI